jgi:hypothetical protein
MGWTGPFLSFIWWIGGQVCSLLKEAGLGNQPLLRKRLIFFFFFGWWGGGGGGSSRRWLDRLRFSWDEPLEKFYRWVGRAIGIFNFVVGNGS